MFKLNQFTLSIGLVLLLIIILAGTKAFQISAAIAEGKSHKEPPSAVTTQIMKKEKWINLKHSSGVVRGKESAELAAEAAGRISNIFVNDGAEVTAGTKLVELDSLVEQAQYEAAKAQADLLGKTFERQKRLFESKAISIDEFDRSKLNFLAAAKAAEALKSILERRIIKAPANGKIGVIRVSQGQYVTEGQIIVPFEMISGKYLTFAVPEADIQNLKPGSEVTLKDSRGIKISSKIHSIDPSLSMTSKTAMAKVEIPITEGSLLSSGMFLEVEYATGDAIEVFKLPSTGIQHAPYGDQVYVIKKLENQEGIEYTGAVPKFVKIASKQGDYTGIIEGITEGEEIVSSGVFKLRPNIEVLINNSQTLPTSENPHPSNS